MKAQGYCHFNEDGNNRSFTINLFDMDLDIEQDPGSRDLGHGAVVWDAAVVLSKYMEKNYKDFDVKSLAKKSVLELGSGCGLGGIAFMMKGAKVSCTDLENVTKRLTEKNVQAAYAKLKACLSGTVSAQTIEPTVYPIDWTHNPICCAKKEGCKDLTMLSENIETMLTNHKDCVSGENMNKSENEIENESAAKTATTPTEIIEMKSSFDSLMSGAPYDYVLLTDCVFAPELAVPLVNTILCGCGPRTNVLCCHEIRDEEANAAFIREFSKYFVLKRIPRSKLHPDYSNDMIEIISAKMIRTKKAEK